MDSFRKHGEEEMGKFAGSEGEQYVERLEMETNSISEKPYDFVRVCMRTITYISL